FPLFSDGLLIAVVLNGFSVLEIESRGPDFETSADIGHIFRTRIPQLGQVTIGKSPIDAAPARTRIVRLDASRSQNPPRHLKRKRSAKHLRHLRDGLAMQLLHIGLHPSLKFLDFIAMGRWTNTSCRADLADA